MLFAVVCDFMTTVATTDVPPVAIAVLLLLQLFPLLLPSI